MTMDRRSEFLRPFRALSDSNYRWYWIGGFGMAGAMGLTQFAVTWLVLDITGSLASLGLVIVAQGFPMTLIALFGGVLADRHDRRKLLIGAQTVSMASILLLSAAVLMDIVHLWHVFANSILLGSTLALTQPARQALISDLVPPEQRINAIALNSVQQHASRIVWPSVAAGVIAVLGIGPALLVTAGCFLLGIIGIVMIRGLKMEPRFDRPSPLRSLAEGISYTRTAPQVSRVIGLTLVFGLSSLAFIQMAPGFARAGLGFSAAQTGVFMLCIGLGALAGGAMFTVLQLKSSATLCTLAMMSYSLTLILFAVNPWYAGFFVIAFLNGVANSMEVILPNALFQTLVPPAYLGRVISLWFLAAGLAALSALPLGVIGDAYGLQTAFACAGVLFIVVALWVGWFGDRLTGGRRRGLSSAVTGSVEA